MLVKLAVKTSDISVVLEEEEEVVVDGDSDGDSDGIDQANVSTYWIWWLSFESATEYMLLESEKLLFANVVWGISKFPKTIADKTKNRYKFNVNVFIS